MFIFLTCLFWGEIKIQIPDPIYVVENAYSFKNEILLVDRDTCSIMRIKKSGEVKANHQGRGNGPGEFSIPLSITGNDQLTFVADLQKMHVFDDNLVFLSSFSLPNNARDMLMIGDELFVSTNTYPPKQESIWVYSVTGHLKRRIYKHKIKSPEALLPHTEKDKYGNIFVMQPRQIGPEAWMILSDGTAQEKIEFGLPAQYSIPPNPGEFVKKHGGTPTTHKKWKKHWTEPKGLAVLNARYVVIAYELLEDDLISTQQYLDVLDLKTKKLTMRWRKAPGELLFGGDKLYFAIEGDTSLEIVGVDLLDL